jgi:hypothetical protein
VVASAPSIPQVGARHCASRHTASARRYWLRARSNLRSERNAINQRRISSPGDPAVRFQSSRLAGGRPRHTIPSNHSMIQVPSTQPSAIKNPHTNQTSIAFAVIIVNIIASLDTSWRNSHQRANGQIVPPKIGGKRSRLAHLCAPR